MAVDEPVSENSHMQASKNTVAALAAKFASPTPLKPVEQKADRSSPIIEPDVKLRTHSRGNFLDEIHSGGPRLKRAESIDRSAPLIPADLSIKPPNIRGPLNKELEVKVAAKTPLKPVDKSDDRSSPIIESVTLRTVNRDSHLSEIQSGTRLKPAESIDRSAPLIPADLSIKPPNIRGPLNKELEVKVAAKSPLKPVEKSDDRSSPIIESVTLRTVNRDSHLSEIQSGTRLKPAESIDRSGPMIPADLSMRPPNTRGGLNKEIEVRMSAKSTGLKPVDDRTGDRSSPLIDADVSVKTTERTSHLNEIQSGGGVRLKRSESVDRSAPKIEPGIVIKKNVRPALNKEIEKQGKDSTNRMKAFFEEQAKIATVGGIRQTTWKNTGQTSTPEGKFAKKTVIVAGKHKGPPPKRSLKDLP